MQYLRLVTTLYLGLAVALVVSLTAVVIPTTTSASTIIQNISNGSSLINAANARGQSFTAEDPFVSAGFKFNVMNFDRPNLPLLFSLYEGVWDRR